MSLLVVGSVAFDWLESPYGKVERTLGGAATYFSVAASFFTPVHLVGIVGDDFTDADAKIFHGRKIDIEGLERAPGKTFFWAGKYSENLNDRTTLTTELNVFADFKPKLPEKYRKSKFVFLANIAPDLQRDVLQQVTKRPEDRGARHDELLDRRHQRGLAEDAQGRRYLDDQRFRNAAALERTQFAARGEAHLQAGSLHADHQARRIWRDDGRQARRVLRSGISAGRAARSDGRGRQLCRRVHGLSRIGRESSPTFRCAAPWSTAR